MLSAAIQLNAGPDPAANLAAGVRAVREAAAAGAKLIVLPEKWVAYGDAPTLAGAARTLGEWSSGSLRALAVELGIDLVAGSVSERASDGDVRLFNTSLHFSPLGTAAAYRKVHLFDAEVAGRRYRESDAERAGDALVVSEIDGAALRLGLGICFDLRFPEFFGALADRGATVFSLPAAFTERTTRDHWEVLVRARAIENGAYVVAANQCGGYADGSRTGGTSLIVSPWGEILARAGREDPEIIYAELSAASVEQARAALPVRTLRRPAVYEGAIA
ncbi:MAG: carbon-nitrogen hydrolase family protein [Solirubrobacteraceae bacterium]|nr:carbon-nitrogen hydrolase family protein [Solirubrobacteraceae bacterium]